jgi:DNA helicase-2/ATP-dependent DNA helicase PcrA
VKKHRPFDAAYEALNPAQREAVDAIDGPVMVVAGPGTGKTQVLALRIANILDRTDTPPSGVLCLTFTNAGVRAMRERLLRLIGATASEVYIATFHRFAIGIIEKHYGLLDFDTSPMLLADTEAVALADEILQSRAWQHIRPRSDAARYFGDLKSLISLLKRENLSPEQFLAEVAGEVERITSDPDNISSRGARKGELKMESLKEIESLERTREVVEFYTAYEEIKHARGLMDYDDVLAYAVRLAQISEDVRDIIRENYLYVLVDEHQDSSGVQNAFLLAVWGDTEAPNIFVVGDDRQLIYGFGGASLAHFTDFRTAFGRAKEITLIENYRSTQTILDAADALLKSSLADGALHGNSKNEEEKIAILECGYPRDEILLAARDIERRITSGVSPKECAILVPKNHHVRSAVAVLRDRGIPVAASGTVSFFSAPETKTIRDIMRVASDPYDNVAIASLLFDPVFSVPPIEAHKFLREHGTRKLSLDTLALRDVSVFPADPIARLGAFLADVISCSSNGLHSLVQKIGEEAFFKNPKDHEQLVRQVEIVRTYIHLVESQMEQDPHLTLASFLGYLDRLEEYGHEIPLAVFSADIGVRVLTLHGSKGLEFAHVYVAHLDDSSLMKGRRMGFTLPVRIDALIEQKDEMVARRELYVAITRAKETCMLSYPRRSYTGAELEPARILADLPDNLVVRKTLAETEGELLKDDPKIFVEHIGRASMSSLDELKLIVAEEYAWVNVSVTLLNNFFECTWKWYFRSLLQLPEQKTESLLLGSVVHTGIEYILKHRDAVDPLALDAALHNCLEKEYACDEKLIGRVFRDAKKILENFTKTYLPSIRADAESERSITYKDPKFPHLTCYGKIDMTERESESVVHVTDFKTGSAKSKSTIEKPDGEEKRMSSLLRQLAMYSYLIESTEKGTSVALSKLLFIEAKPGDKDAIYAKAITNEEIVRLKQDIQDYDHLVQSGEWATRDCEAKLFGQSRECEYCARAKLLYK